MLGNWETETLPKGEGYAFAMPFTSMVRIVPPDLDTIISAAFLLPGVRDASVPTFLAMIRCIDLKPVIAVCNLTKTGRIIHRKAWQNEGLY